MAMRLIITSTDEIVTIDGRPARVWHGVERPGVHCTVYVRAIRVDNDTQQIRFVQELREIGQLEVKSG